MSEVINSVIAKGAGNVLFGGEKLRGPNATADFVYEVMVEVALELTDRLPEMFEDERIHNGQLAEYFKKNGNKGKYTDTYGWDKSRKNKFSFSVSPTFFNYFQRIIAPFLGGDVKFQGDETSAIWKRIKRLIISGDKVEISKLQREIKRNIIKESKKKVRVSTDSPIIQSASMPEGYSDGADTPKIII